MKKFVVVAGEWVLRAKELWGEPVSDDDVTTLQGAKWDNVKTTRSAIYSEQDLVGEDGTYYIFRLPTSALPWVRIAIRKKNIAVKE